MRNIKAILGTIVLAGLLPCFVVASPAQLDKIVAVVNQGVITKGEVDKKISMVERQLKGSADVPKRAALRQQVLDSLIDISLQLQLAKRVGIQVDEKELDAIIANIAKEHNLTLAQLKQTVVERDGISFMDFRKQIREQVIISRVQQQFLGKDIAVSDKEIEAILRNPPKMEGAGVPPAQYHATDILLEIADDASVEQQKLVANVANKMAVKLRKGQSVEEVVKDGQQNLNEGMIIQNNDLGWRKLDEMPDLFGKEIAKLEVNQVLGPLKAPNGLHLIKLLGVNGGAAVKAFKITKEQARDMVLHRKLSEKLKPWLKEQRDAAYIKVSE